MNLLNYLFTVQGVGYLLDKNLLWNTDHIEFNFNEQVEVIS